MLCKYYLQFGKNTVDINDANCMEVGDMIANLDDIKVRYKRTGFNGVVRTISSEVIFIHDAYDRILSEYQRYGLDMKLSFAIYLINENWTYSELWQAPLDLSTFHYDRYKLGLGFVDSSAAALIKANKGTKFEYPTADLVEPVKLDYDRIVSGNSYDVQMMGDPVTGESYMQVENDTVYDYDWLNIALARYNESISTQDSIVLNNGFNMTTFGRTNAGTEEEYYFEALKDCVVNMDFTNFRVWGTKMVPVYTNNGQSGYQFTPISTNRLKIVYMLYEFNPEDPVNDIRLLASSNREVEGGTTNYFYPCDIRGNFHIRKGYRVRLQALAESFTTEDMHTIPHTLSNGSVIYLSADRGKVMWDSRATNIYMSVIKPVTLLNKLLESIGGDKMQIRGVINDLDDERLRNTMLLPAEEIRGFNNPTVYSSFKDFCDMMETVFGYVYTIEEAEVENSLNMELFDFDEFYTDYSELPSGYVFVTGSLAVIAQKVVYLAAEGRFYGMSDFNGVVYIYHLWRGCPDYLDYAHGYGPIDGKVYFSKSEYAPFVLNGRSSLKPYYLEDIDTMYHDKIKPFHGIINDMVQDDRFYDGQVDGNDIFFVVGNNCFMCKDQGGLYYSGWHGSDDYNEGAGVRDKTVFQLNTVEGKFYALVNESRLLPYLADEVDLDTRTEAAIVRFMHRTELFSTETALELEQINDVQMTLSSDRIFSELRIGYEKKDYDLGNSGNDEWNFTNRYTLKTPITDKVLEMYCPYRADCYGIEELAQKRNIETSSTDSDSDIFLVKVNEPNPGSDQWTGLHTLDRSIAVEGAYSDTVFNATYAPTFCLDANRHYLCSFSYRVRFASMDGNNSIVFVYGNNTRRPAKASTNFGTRERIFGHFDISVKTNDQEPSLDWNGLVQFEWNGKLCKGFVESVTFCPHRPEVVEYQLLEYTVENIS